VIYLVISHSPMGSVLGVKSLTPTQFSDYEQQHGDTVVVLDGNEVIRHWTYYA
jgi:hypothetical protein